MKFINHFLSLEEKFYLKDKRDHDVHLKKIPFIVSFIIYFSFIRLLVTYSHIYILIKTAGAIFRSNIFHVAAELVAMHEKKTRRRERAKEMSR